MEKTYDEIEDLCDRNKWFIGHEAVDIKIADKLIAKN
jgi:ATP-dependent protease ClpP protease subunit